MGDVIGPIPTDDLLLMLMLRGSIKMMKKNDPDKYRTAINKETSVLTYFYSKYLTQKQDERLDEAA